MIVPDGVILSCAGLELSNSEIEFFRNINPLGFVLFKRNFKNKKQITKLIKQLKKITINRNILIFVDQEGGKVQRLDNDEFIKFPPQRVFGDIYSYNKDLAIKLAYKSSFLMGKELKDVGIDVDFSPVCDLFFDTAHDIIGNRAFGTDTTLVYNLSKVFCDGLLDSGIIPVPKHFPGHGRSINDTHNKASVINTKYEELKKTDFVPFRILEKSYMVMLAHIIYSNIDKEVATYSKKINNNILRGQFNFKGLILSDDISMKAIKGNLSDKTRKSYYGGCNVILYCKGILDEIKVIYPNVQKIDLKVYNFFLKKINSINIKKKNIHKFKADLLEYGLI